MSRSSRPSRLLIRTALAAALVSIGCFAPTRAHASCGDYVTIGAHHGAALDYGTPHVAIFGWSTHDVAAPSRAQRDEQPAVAAVAPVAPACGHCPLRPHSPGNVPCQGPGCSSYPGPLATPPSIVETSGKQWGALELPTVLVEIGQIPHRYLSTLLDRVHHVVPVYHPPRSA
jgi:hypothetical protein